MKDKITKDIGETVFILDGNGYEIMGVISMIMVTKKGIKYRAKFGFDNQRDFWQDEIIDS